MANILTLDEALQTLKMDADFDGEIQATLVEIDRTIWAATGVDWSKETRNPNMPIAKSLAKIKLRLLLNYSTNPEQDKDRETYLSKQLQAISAMGYEPDEETPDEITMLGELEKGDIVQIAVRGQQFRKFVIVSQGNPSDDYVGYDNATMLMAVNSFEEHVYSVAGATQDNPHSFPTSLLFTWLQNDYANILNEKVRENLISGKIPYARNVDGIVQVFTGDNGVECKVFTPSLREMGFHTIPIGTQSQIPVATLFGTDFGLFETNTDRIFRMPTNIARSYHMRDLASRGIGNSNAQINIDGNVLSGGVGHSGVAPRPIFALPQTMEFDRANIFIV